MHAAGPTLNARCRSHSRCVLQAPHSMRAAGPTLDARCRSHARCALQVPRSMRAAGPTLHAVHTTAQTMSFSYTLSQGNSTVAPDVCHPSVRLHTHRASHPQSLTPEDVLQQRRALRGQQLWGVRVWAWTGRVRQHTRSATAEAC
eukprot:359022-Chlamydomonas_euryale.AAC.2